MASTFHPFPALAPELRRAIWQAALPDCSGSSIFFYRDDGYWCARRLAESEEGYIAGRREMGMVFRTDILENDNQFYVPLVWVNRKARGIAVAWFRAEGIAIPPKRSNGQYLFARPFSGSRDVLYIADDRWVQFYLEPTNRMAEPDLIDQNLDISSDLTKIAISDTFFKRQDMVRDLPAMQLWFQWLTVIFVVVGTQPDETRGLWRWEVPNTTSGVFVWHEGKQEFLFKHGDNEEFGDDVYRMIGEAVNTGLREAMRARVCAAQGLEVQPVSVMRK